MLRKNGHVDVFSEDVAVWLKRTDTPPPSLPGKKCRGKSLENQMTQGLETSSFQ